MKRFLLISAFGVLLASTAQALQITPSTTPVYTSNNNSQPSVSDIETLVGAPAGSLTLVYKADQGSGDANGLLADDWYSTTYDNSPTDPQDADIIWGGGSDFISGPSIFLHVKDGGNAPSLYVFDISGWDGQETLELRDFWPQQGAISNIGIYTGTFVSTPDGGATIALLGLGFLSLAVFGRKTF